MHGKLYYHYYLDDASFFFFSLSLSRPLNHSLFSFGIYIYMRVSPNENCFSPWKHREAKAGAFFFFFESRTPSYHCTYNSCTPSCLRSLFTGLLAHPPPSSVMFGRRVFASAPLPRHMWAKLHIQNAAQAQRMLPTLAPLAASLGRSTNVLNSQAFMQARDGMASERGSAALEELLALRLAAGSPALVNAVLFTIGKISITVNTPLVSFFQLCKCALRHGKGQQQL